MMKVGKKPKDAFTSEEPSWFWTTFEFDYNSGLTNARKLISYSDALPIRKRTQLLQAANLDDTNFINYSSNGTQIRFSDTKNTNIILGNTKMEDFAGNPNSGEEKKTPEKWVSWVSSCHTCHATASVNPNLPIGDLRFFYPFTVQTGTLPVEQLQGYRDLDFIWSIPFRTLKP